MFQYPADIDEAQEPGHFGVYPVDFILETVIEAGLTWFVTDPKAPGLVFGQMKAPWLGKYGPAKIEEITDYVKKYRVNIVQHFSLIDANLPCFSIQILDANEEESRAALSDHFGMLDRTEDGVLTGRQSIGYSPIIDSVHIGIHAQGTPDLCKYLYYLLVYILNAFKPQLMERGLQLSSFRATDISRLNDFLPDHVFSRFVNFSCFTIAPFAKDEMPIIENILGLHLPNEQSSSPNNPIEGQTGITLADRKDLP